MNKVTFITGNQTKADFLAKFLGYTVDHQKVDLDEIQSLDLKEISEDKARRAYEVVKGPVLIEDVSLRFNALGKLPGPLTKWFEQELGLEKMCRLLDPYDDKTAVGEICFVYFDGNNMEFFEGRIEGIVPERPQGEGGFGWNPIFIPNGADKSLAEMNDEETEKYSLRTTTVYPELKEFLQSLDKK